MAEIDVCVVGAGFAGLTAATSTETGRSFGGVAGGARPGWRPDIHRDSRRRVWIDRGGAWIGPGQDRIYALMGEFGVPSYKQHTDGDAMMIVDGKRYRYHGTIPWTMNPWTSLNLSAVFFELGRMCKSIPLEAPWEARKADKWDRISLAEWLNKKVMSKSAHDLLETAIAGSYTSAASEVSMLFALYQMASSGMGAIYRPMAAELGDVIQLSQPVQQITQDADGVMVRSDRESVRARHVIVAVPLAIAGQIIYEPMLPVDRAFLHQRMPSGSIVKISIVYGEPFWRADGLSGQSAAPGSLATVTIDACTDAGRPAVLCVITEGPAARQYGQLDEAQRRQTILDGLVDRFGAKAGAPVDYIEQNWSVERYSGGGMLSHAPTGVLTQFGHALREPCGRIHWAGTETSALMCGWVDGAIRSGERAAGEVMASLALTSA